MAAIPEDPVIMQGLKLLYRVWIHDSYKIKQKFDFK